MKGGVNLRLVNPRSKGYPEFTPGLVVVVHNGNQSQSYGYLPCGITQCYLPPDTGKCTPLSPQPSRPVPDLLTPERWKADRVNKLDAHLNTDDHYYKLNKVHITTN